MLIGEATLKTANFSHRLMLLLDELRDAGCTVWLEGMNVRFDLPGEVSAASELKHVAALGAVLSRYSDVVSWAPLQDVTQGEEAVLGLDASLTSVSESSSSPVPNASSPRRNGFFSFRRAHPTYKEHR